MKHLFPSEAPRPSAVPRFPWIDWATAGLVALVIASAAFLVVFLNHRWAEEAKDILERHAGEDRAILETKAGQAGLLLRELSEDAGLVAGLPEVRRGDRAGAAAALERLRGALSTGLPVVGVVGVPRDFAKSGKWLFRADLPALGEEKRVAWLAETARRWDEEAARTGGMPDAAVSPFLVVSDGVLDARGRIRQGSRQGFLYAVPFRDPAGRYGGLVAVALRGSDVGASLSGTEGSVLRGRFVLAREDSDVRLVEPEGDALRLLPLDDPGLVTMGLGKAGFPGWRLGYLWDRADLQWDLDSRREVLAHREQMAVGGTLAVIVLLFLGRWALRSHLIQRARLAELEAARARIGAQATLLDEAHDALYALDVDGTVCFWNRAAALLYGLPVEKVLGRKIGEALAPVLAPEAVLPEFSVVMADGKRTGEIAVQRPDGAMRAIETHWMLVRGRDGTARGFFVVDFDATERRGYEARLQRAQKMENLGALASGIAHDLNNALTPVIVGAQLLKDTHDEADRAALLQTILASAERGTAMVRQILGFVRGGSGENAFLAADRLMEEMAKIARDTFPKSITVEVKIGKKLARVLGNATELHQVFLNLCVNARDAMLPQGGRLVLEARNARRDAASLASHPGVEPGSFVLLSVADSGSGIPPEVLPRIFEPLFTTKDPGKGTGLGLSTVAAIVGRMGGIIEVESAIGLGTRFLVSLPAVEGGVEEKAKAESKELPSGNGEKILLVDDDATIRRLTKAMLENYGYRVVSASNGLEAASIFGRHQEEISLLISDSDMPYMDGLELIAMLRRMAPDLPAILSSGSELSDAYKARLEKEGVPFLLKPYGVEALLVEIAGALAGRSRLAGVR